MIFIRPLLHKIYHQYINRDDLYELIRFYRETQYWPYDKLKQFQLLKLDEMVYYCYHNVPYYKKLFQSTGLKLHEISNPENFRKISFLNKDLIRINQAGLLSTTFEKKYLKTNSTSGSTGTNLKFYSDKKTRHTQAMLFRNHDWMDLDFFDKEITIWGASWDVNKAKQFLTSIKSKLKGNILLSGYQLSDEMLLKYHKILTDYNPRLIRSYPSVLYMIADFYEKKNLKFQPKAIESAGEKLHPFQREKIEEVFRTKIFDFYGARDIPLIAQECEYHKGLHIMIENVYLEVVDDNGAPIDEGEGELVLTHLNNKAMPFIRYKIGDRARISKRMCNCGRSLPMIEEVTGRSFEVIEFPNGNKVGGSFWTLVMRSSPGIRNFQVIQNNIDHIKINYIPEGDNIKVNLENFKNRITPYSGPGLKIEFIEVENIPLSNGGKYRFVISDTKSNECPDVS